MTKKIKMTKHERNVKGGLARAMLYRDSIIEVVRLFTTTDLSQFAIAKNVGVSQGFVSKHTNSKKIKIAREAKTELSKEEINLMIDEMLMELDIKADRLTPAEKPKVLKF